MIESHNGPKGGYLLARNPGRLPSPRCWKAWKVPSASPIVPMKKKANACMQREHCNIRTPLLKVQNSIYQLLNNMTLQDMMGGTPLITIHRRHGHKESNDEVSDLSG